ncbi:hypothetical protein P3X46_023444 [Hevea brasiliensis]|uniref:High-affinity nitrate transporter n=1 Tax=Hevea brasiliensis TaxID=3981 RepID=A0ABQ9LAZ8_HEVBR|nr:high-affinity nitrate transporter 3.1 isoform X2 [Hevea brasiliensis]KAJ9163815.1 hypothetical protein P3X46_023444 [Hevea brasiliensis]
MAAYALLLASILFSCLCGSSYGFILFSSLQKTLLVTASPRPGQGVDNITVSWGVNQTLPAGTDAAYKTIKVKLCYAPVSQTDRAWRKTEDNLSKDKTCQFAIVSRPYTSTNNNQSFTWTVERDVPTATYFVRAYAYNSDGAEVAYGQSTDAHKTTNLFEIQAITGRHVSLDIASVCFSAFSVLALFGFFMNEKRKAKRTRGK